MITSATGVISWVSCCQCWKGNEKRKYAVLTIFLDLYFCFSSRDMKGLCDTITTMGRFYRPVLRRETNNFFMVTFYSIILFDPLKYPLVCLSWGKEGEMTMISLRTDAFVSGDRFMFVSRSDDSDPRNKQKAFWCMKHHASSPKLELIGMYNAIILLTSM